MSLFHLPYILIPFSSSPSISDYNRSPILTLNILHQIFAIY
nr:MAG TPA: hypothetical protein [Caudoviricetes sp.]